MSTEVYVEMQDGLEQDALVDALILMSVLRRHGQHVAMFDVYKDVCEARGVVVRAIPRLLDQLDAAYLASQLAS